MFGLGIEVPYSTPDGDEEAKQRGDLQQEADQKQAEHEYKTDHHGGQKQPDEAAVGSLLNVMCRLHGIVISGLHSPYSSLVLNHHYVEFRGGLRVCYIEQVIH